MIDFILDIVALAIVFWAGVQYAQLKFMFRISKDPEKFINMLEQIREINKEEGIKLSNGVPEDAIEMEIEKVNDVVYAYDKATGEFLAQAQSIYQAALLASARFPNKKFWHPELNKDHQTT